MSNRNNSVSVHPLRRQIAIGDFVTFQHGDRWLCGTVYGADAGALDIITAERPNPEVHPLLFGAREHVMNWRVPRIDAVRLVREDQQGARFARARSLAVAFMLRQEPESADMLAAAEIVEALGPVDEGANEPAPAERKPVAGWVEDEDRDPDEDQQIYILRTDELTAYATSEGRWGIETTKGPTLKDLKKARWYIDREIQRIEAQAAKSPEEP